jgi:hypothetical protein
MTVLGLCRAIVVAPTLYDSHALADLALELGFGDVASIQSDSSGNGLKYRVSFFLVHHRLGDKDCDDIIDAVRHIGRDDLCYSPMVVMLPEISTEPSIKFVRMGFDDVISLPQDADRLAARLERQLDRDIVYFHTGDYLGPDRRRLDTDSAKQRRSRMSPHTRLVIRRDAEHGVHVVSRQSRGGQTFQTVVPGRRTFGRRQPAVDKQDNDRAE